MSTVLNTIAGFFFTYTCPFCDSFDYDFENEALCSKCSEKLHLIKAPYCKGCGAELDGVLELCSKCLNSDVRPWCDAVSVFHMRGLGSDLIHQFKYNGSFEFGRSLGCVATDAVLMRNLRFEVIVPIPLHWWRTVQRGFNQSELIAEQLSVRLKIPMEKLLQRNRHTKQQAKLDKNEREKNLMNAFSTIAGANYKKRSILLVDDVMTTGATLTEATNELLKEVATEVNILVLARR